MGDFIEEFHKHFYNSQVWVGERTTWLGVPVAKCPLDLFLYQEMIYEIKPDLIVECGTFKGGSALYFASILDHINKGKVLSFDIYMHPDLPEHRRITYVKASSTSKEAIENVKTIMNPGDTVMVILDSCHEKDHVLEELELYSPFVSKGSYLVVEDTNINGHPVYPDYGPGPMEAIDEFLLENDDFQVDESKHKFHLTFQPRGYLRKL